MSLNGPCVELICQQYNLVAALLSILQLMHELHRQTGQSEVGSA